MRRRVVLVLAVLAAFAVGGYRMHVQREAEVDAAADVSSAVAPRAFYGRRLEPREAVVLHGAGQSDEASFAAYSLAVAPAKPMLMMRYVDLRDDVPAFFARLRDDLATHAELLVPQIGVSMVSAGVAYDAETARGAEDARITALCAGLRSLQRPVFVRIGYEFNGPWNGYSPAAYVAAYRRVAQGIHVCGDVALVWDWSADAELDRRSGAQDAAARWNAFYPGDDVVDWWGLNVFRAATMRSAATLEFLREADARKYPVMIAESSPRGAPVSDGQRAVDAWFAPYFGLLRSQPGIKAFCYIDWEWSRYPQWADWGDARIEDNAAVLAFYRSQVVGNVLFAGARGRDETLRLLRAK